MELLRRSICILNFLRLLKNVHSLMHSTRNKRFNRSLNLLVKNLSLKLKKLKNNNRPKRKIKIRLVIPAQVERVMTMIMGVIL